MKSNDEMFNSIIEYKNNFEANRQKKQKKISKALLTSACCAFIAVTALIVTQSKTFEKIHKSNEKISEEIATEPRQDKTAQDEYKALSEIVSTYEETVTSTSISSTPRQWSGGDIYYGGTVGGLFQPAVFKNEDGTLKLTEVGERITDEEAQKYFAENRNWIVSSLSSSGVSANAIRFADKGYCHISNDGEETSKLKLNFRDYLVYNNNKLTAIITLVKENGKITGTPAFGAPWFDDYNNFLQSHKGEKLLFIYHASREYVITPDGITHNTLGYEIAPDFSGIENVYEFFYNENIVYIP